MPVKVLLRGFEPAIPEDQPVTFSNDLPDSVLCIQCTNVSSTLYKDPGGHGYCGCCKRMCTTEDGFDCSTCGQNFRLEKLVLDETTRRKLAEQIVICPNSTKLEAKEILFSELKAHLNGCSCGSYSGLPNPGKQGEGIQHKAMNPQEPAQPYSVGSSKQVACTNCQETMPKKLIPQHVQACLKSPERRMEHSSPCEVFTQQITSAAKTSGVALVHKHPYPQQTQEPCAGEQTPSGKYQGATTVTSAPSLTHKTVNDLQSEVRELNKAIRQKDTDIEHLKATVIALQEDVKGVQLRSETRITKAERTIVDLKEQCDYLQEVVDINDGERKKLHAEMNEMKSSFRAEILQLTEHIGGLYAKLAEGSGGGRKPKEDTHRKNRGSFV